MATLKYSRQRESIKEFLRNRTDHPTADVVYENMKLIYPNISLGTVYRNLSLLADLGEIKKLSSFAGADHFDGRTERHCHFMCTRSERIMDLESEGIHHIMELAGENFGGKISLEGSSWGSHDASLSVETPIGDTLGARVTIRDFKRGGYYKNAGPQGGELGEQTTQSLSGSLVWRPTDGLKIKFHGSVFEDDDGPPAQGALKPADASGLVPSDFTGRVDANGNCVPFSQAPAGTAAIGQAANSRASFGYWCGELPGFDGLHNLLSGDYTSNEVACAEKLMPRIRAAVAAMTANSIQSRP